MQYNLIVYSYFVQIFSRTSCEMSHSGTLDSQSVQETEMPRSDEDLERGQVDANRHPSLNLNSGINEEDVHAMLARMGAEVVPLPVAEVEDQACILSELEKLNHDT
jgi:hypothetical protein